jgi:hypothetical protein
MRIRMKQATRHEATHVAWCNFCRKHETLKGKTPEVASGLADKTWSIRGLPEQAAGYRTKSPLSHTRAHQRH